MQKTRTISVGTYPYNIAAGMTDNGDKVKTYLSIFGEPYISEENFVDDPSHLHITWIEFLAEATNTLEVWAEQNSAHLSFYNAFVDTLKSIYPPKEKVSNAS